MVKTFGNTNKEGQRFAKRIMLIQALCFKKPTPRNFDFGLDFPIMTISHFMFPLDVESKEFKKELKRAR